MTSPDTLYPETTCPHCNAAIAPRAVRCHHCKKWVNQLSTALFMQRFQQAITGNWAGYIGISLFFAGVVMSLSLQTMRFNWAECFKFAMGHQLRAWLWFGVASVIAYMWVRPLGVRNNERLFQRLASGLMLLFVACQYAESWMVPANIRYYNDKQDTLSQIHLRERTNRHNWFGQTTRKTPFNPQPVGSQRVKAVVNGVTGVFGVNTSLQHSVINRRFIDRNLLELPPTLGELHAGQERWAPVYVQWQVFTTPQGHPVNRPDVLTWVQTDGPAAAGDWDGILGRDIIKDTPQ
jgi:hypothetical protein